MSISGGAWHRRALSAFRLIAVTVAGIQTIFLAEKTGPWSVSPVIVVIIAAVYSLAKTIEPYGWYRSSAAKLSLIFVDLLASASFVILTGGTHSPFLVYSLVPVVLSALLFGLRLTSIVACVTAGYVLSSFLAHPVIAPEEQANAWSDLVVYLPLLGLVILLPYISNVTQRRRLLAVAEIEERKRLAREIHDGLCQILYVLRLHTQVLSLDIGDTGKASEGLKHLEVLAKKAEDEARASLNSLGSSGYGVNLLSQVQDCLDKLRDECEIEGRLEADVDSDALDEMVNLELARICQEALRNVAKHSAAHHVSVSLRRNGGHVELKIRDDGHGFVGIGKTGSAYGLAAMRQRAERLGGEFKVVAGEGTGTEVSVSVPRKLPMDALL